MSDEESKEGEPTDGPSSEVRVAKITARQAIIVAVITAFAGLAVALVPKLLDGKSSEPQVQQWLSIDNVTFLSWNDAPLHFRLIIRVNGQAYSYPSRRLFMTSNSQVSRETFPIPIGDETPRVSFEGFYSERGTVITDMRPQLISEEVVEVRETPFNGTYLLRESTDTWSTTPSASIAFSVFATKP